MKHTPAPWTAHDDGLITAGPRRLHIAQTATTGMGYTAAANARLIAAAPDLLELAAQIVLAADQREAAIPADIVAGARAAIKTATAPARGQYWSPDYA